MKINNRSQRSATPNRGTSPTPAKISRIVRVDISCDGGVTWQPMSSGPEFALAGETSAAQALRLAIGYNLTGPTSLPYRVLVWTDTRPGAQPDGEWTNVDAGHLVALDDLLTGLSKPEAIRYALAAAMLNPDKTVWMFDPRPGHGREVWISSTEDDADPSTKAFPSEEPEDLARPPINPPTLDPAAAAAKFRPQRTAANPRD